MAGTGRLLSSCGGGRRVCAGWVGGVAPVLAPEVGLPSYRGLADTSAVGGGHPWPRPGSGDPPASV